MEVKMMPYDPNGDITPQSIARALTILIKPFYKGYPDPVTQKPQFRKSLTGIETSDLLMNLHIIITSIMLKVKDEDVS